MKYLLVLLLLCITSNCASMRKCDLNGLPPAAPTHEEIIKQAVIKMRTASAEQAWDKALSVVVEELAKQNVNASFERKETVCVNVCTFAVIRATISVDNKPPVNELYWLLEFFEDEWQVRGVHTRLLVPMEE